jgi:17beta-estradiol 17-dehydrogenase / very-long-chain 3-oxoacyl-CoA reductase
MKLKISNIIKNWAIRRIRNRYYTNDGWVMISGCTSGIGKAYAEILNKSGFNLVLISRNEEKLKLLEKNLKQQNENLKVNIISWDFSKDDIYNKDNFEKSYEMFSKLNIRLLVNNVGETTFGGDFIKQDICVSKRLQNVNINSNIFLTQLFIKSQLQFQKMNNEKPTDSKRGIINISSYFGLRPVPGLTTYSSTKSYISNFSSCLYQELKSIKEIKFDILCMNPLFVRTKMVSKWKKNLLIRSPEDIVYSSFIKINGYKTHTYGHYIHSIQAIFLNFIPNFIFSQLIYNFYKKQYEKLISRRKK